MKSLSLYMIAIGALVLLSCSDDSSGAKHGTDDNIGNIDLENHDNLPSAEVNNSGQCKDTSLKEMPGECGCQFEDTEIGGKIYCPVRVMPQNILPKLEEIPGDCGGWEYPKHHIVQYPKLPEFGLEVTIDTDAYGISRTYTEDKEVAEATTKGLNKAIKDYKEQGFTRIVIPPGHYPLTSQGIAVVSEMALIMSKDVILQMIPVSRWDCGLITISGVHDVYIEGGNLIGERFQHTNTTNKNTGATNTDEECGGIQGSNDQRIFINGLHIKSVHGDGIMIYKSKNHSTNEDLIIANCEIDEAYRNGLAPCGNGIRISNNHIHHTHGAAPQFGIDLECGTNERVIIDHNTFNDNRNGDLVLSSKVADTTFIEYNSFSIGDLDRHGDAEFVPWSKNSFILYRNYFAKPAPSGGCSGQLTCTYGSREEDNNVKTFVVENDFPAQRIVLNRYNYMCIKGNVSHEGVISVGGVPNLRLLDNRIEKFSDNPVQGKREIAIPKNSVKGIASGNVLCTLDDSGKEVCKEITALNEMKEDEYFPGRFTETF
ncbi:MAG: right-handed parallel beta-helix repeat-containing protein [Proteobacteria bacterium]|nr:right-handed parallel beta-helix repeat-containing protein [Pseudomonadota bacterium]